MRRLLTVGVLLAGAAGALLSLELGSGTHARAAAPPPHTSVLQARVPQAARRAAPRLAPTVRAMPETCDVATSCSEHPCAELIGAGAASPEVSVAGTVYAPTTPRPRTSCRGASARSPGVDRVGTALVAPVAQPASAPLIAPTAK